ncbi:MAG TPA: SIR2 family protein [Bacteroidia bacterium]|nr:SIR2 family protein [Bacteroidia bacterium]
MRKVLLLGNGINRIDNNYSWNNLMDDLLAYAKMEDAITLDNKPFPLLYEEIYLRLTSYEHHPEAGVKEKIAELVRNVKSNDLHRKAMRLNADEILTTNYDYNLESVTAGGVRGARPIKPVKGSKYSIMRRRKAGKKVIWHIHGECHAPGTILLGYHQYAGYLQTIRNYVTKGLRYKDVHFEPLTKRLKDGDTEIRTWIDHFFMSDVYILGLNMDFVEIHLWLLLNLRARLFKAPNKPFQNKVTYIYAAPETPWIKPRIDLLCACGVSCIALPVVDNNWKDMYKHALDMVDKA